MENEKIKYLNLIIVLKSLLPWCCVCAGSFIFWVLTEIQGEQEKDLSEWWVTNSTESVKDYLLFSVIAIAGVGGLLTQAMVVLWAERRGWPENKFKRNVPRIAIAGSFVVGFIGFLVLLPFWPSVSK